MTKTKSTLGISNLGHCDLFAVWNLLFEIIRILLYSCTTLPLSIFAGKGVEQWESWAVRSRLAIKLTNIDVMIIKKWSF